MVDEAETVDNPPAGTPKTGDDRNFALWIFLAGLALAGVGSSAVLLRKKKKD
jgi:LPXTG-motif cell wall-anchored protein